MQNDPDSYSTSRLSPPAAAAILGSVPAKWENNQTPIFQSGPSRPRDLNPAASERQALSSMVMAGRASPSPSPAAWSACSATRRVGGTPGLSRRRWTTCARRWCSRCRARRAPSTTACPTSRPPIPACARALSNRQTKSRWRGDW
ncbi:hypothetical protein PAHAL_5G165400 [Panicum hallii]|uniref:Uncharacterized protein n=1 Tax=Panicum hallii TaxID=206008 RepID=A0A2T8IK68_9POAL|nr:hypothetical protein PAHAL_5G165400 [Panicum hallii]